jgi:hypothetical protein
MARPLRIEYAGAIYHVMARGNHGQSLFADDQDGQRVTPGWPETGGGTWQSGLENDRTANGLSPSSLYG